MANLAIYYNVLEEARRVDMREKRRRQREERYVRAAMSADDNQFIGLYRLSKELFNELVIELTPLLKTAHRRGEEFIKCKVCHSTYTYCITSLIFSCSYCVLTLYISTK
jgi:protein-arginine kinase activator protein McsA